MISTHAQTVAFNASPSTLGVAVTGHAVHKEIKHLYEPSANDKG